MIKLNTPKQLQSELLEKSKDIENNYYLALFICESRGYKLPFDIKEMLSMQPNPVTKWALIPVTDPDSIKILTKEEVEATLKESTYFDEIIKRTLFF